MKRIATRHKDKTISLRVTQYEAFVIMALLGKTEIGTDVGELFGALVAEFPELPYQIMKSVRPNFIEVDKVALKNLLFPE
jgi:hypothetical protein